MVEPISLRRLEPAPLRVFGIARDAENDRALICLFSRRATDAELRYLHEVVQRAVACMPDVIEGRDA